MQSRDTSPEVQAILNAHYRRMSPAEKWKAVEDAWETALTFALAGLRLDFPGETEEQLEGRWAERRLGKELYAKALTHKLSLAK